MSLFVAVPIVTVLCSRFLNKPDHGEGRKGVLGAVYLFSEKALNSVDATYARCTLPLRTGRRCLPWAQFCS